MLYDLIALINSNYWCDCLMCVCVRARAGVWSSIDNVAVFRLRTHRSKPEQQKTTTTAAAAIATGAANAVAPQTMKRTGKRIKMQCLIESVCACKTQAHEHTRIRINAINHWAKIEQTMAMLVCASNKNSKHICIQWNATRTISPADRPRKNSREKMATEIRWVSRIYT